MNALKASFKYYTLKLWEIVRFKLLLNMEPVALNRIIEWISENLLIIAETEPSSQ